MTREQIESILESTGVNDLKDLTAEQEKVVALMKHLKCTYDEAKKMIDSEKYLVYTDSEANEAVNDCLEDFLDDELDYVFKDFPHYRPYFDRESYKRDALLEGRGHILSTYDGGEYEEEVNNTYYYIYRME